MHLKTVLLKDMGDLQLIRQQLGVVLNFPKPASRTCAL